MARSTLPRLANLQTKIPNNLIRVTFSIGSSTTGAFLWAYLVSLSFVCKSVKNFLSEGGVHISKVEEVLNLTKKTK